MTENPYQPPRDLRPGMQRPAARDSILGPALALISFSALVVMYLGSSWVQGMGWHALTAAVGGSIAATLVLCYMSIRNVIFPTYHD